MWVDVETQRLVFRHRTRKRAVLEAIRFPEEKTAVVATIEVEVDPQGHPFGQSITGIEVHPPIFGKGAVVVGGLVEVKYAADQIEFAQLLFV